MPSWRTTILRWTGRGKFSDLLDSVSFVISQERGSKKVVRVGDSVVVEGPEPIGVAALLGQMPGVSWVAAGTAAGSPKQLSLAAGVLAKKYLRSGDRFSVDAEGGDAAKASDLRGGVTSGVLGAVRGSRVSADSPKVAFRAALDGGSGAVGVEVKAGPGGAPTGEEPAACLVSGGLHSSVVAWYAVLGGFRVRLVHVAASDESLRAVAMLYSELSHRADPRWLSLEVIEGNTVLGAASGRAGQARGRVFCGVTRGSGRGRRGLKGAEAPLYLMPEERFLAQYESLGIGGTGGTADWKAKATGRTRTRRFGGRAADVSSVLDGLR